MISGRWPCRCRPPPPIRGRTRNRLLLHWGTARRQTGARQAPSPTFAAAGAAFWLRPSKVTCRCIVPWGEDTEKNSTNSSKPPSTDIVKPPPEKRGKRSKRRIGAQKGHPKHERPP